MHSEPELCLNLPSVLEHVVQVQVLVVVVPADYIQVMVVIEHVVAEAADLGQIAVALHQVRLDIELEAFLRPLLLVESTEDKNVLAVNWHAHRQVAGRPRRLGIQVHHTPHVVVDVVHLYCVGDFLFVELGTARKDINVLIVEDATGS